MKTQIKTTIQIATAIMALALASVSFAQPTLPPAGTNSPPTPEQIAAWQAAQAAHEAALLELVQQQYAPFSNQGILTPGGYAPSVEALDAAQAGILQMLAIQNGAVADADLIEVEAITATNGLTRKFTGDDGSVAELMSIRDGVPRYYCTYNAIAAATVSTPRVWPGGSTGFSLSGSNTVIALWDDANVATNHVEFATNGFRVIDRDGASGGISPHSTHVAGTLVARGVDTAARGMSYDATLHAYGWGRDTEEMPLAAANDHIRLSNHSYGYKLGWDSYQVGTNLYWAWYGYTNSPASVPSAPPMTAASSRMSSATAITFIQRQPTEATPICPARVWRRRT